MVTVNVTCWPTTEGQVDDLNAIVDLVRPEPTVVPGGMSARLPLGVPTQAVGVVVPPSLQAVAPMAIPTKPIPSRARRGPTALATPATWSRAHSSTVSIPMGITPANDGKDRHSQRHP